MVSKQAWWRRFGRSVAGLIYGEAKVLTASDTKIRWMIRRDMPSVLAAEESSYESPWCEEEFISCLRQRNCIGMVAERDDQVVGFMIYELHQKRIHLINLAVHANHRRKGVGLAMISRLEGKLSPERRSRITCEIRERNVPGQLFLRACGFRAISVLREFYEDCNDDAYLFEYRLR